MSNDDNAPIESVARVEGDSAPLSPAAQARQVKRARALRTSIIGISISGGLCVVLGLISIFVPADTAPGFMFASYGAGYVAFMWALYAGYQHFMGPNAAK
jgi:hypothetical protein